MHQGRPGLFAYRGPPSVAPPAPDTRQLACRIASYDADVVASRVYPGIQRTSRDKRCPDAPARMRLNGFVSHKTPSTGRNPVLADRLCPMTASATPTRMESGA